MSSIQEAILSSTMKETDKQSLIDSINSSTQANSRMMINTSTTILLLSIGGLYRMSRYLVYDGSDDNYIKNYKQHVIPFMESL